MEYDIPATIQGIIKSNIYKVEKIVIKTHAIQVDLNKFIFLKATKISNNSTFPYLI
jgi:hypothetical protein